jgi:hypothetical protein
MNNKIIDIPAALQSLKPGAQWVLRGDVYSGLEWLDAVEACPTEEEVQAERDRLQAEYNALQYQRNRSKEYPSIEDQLDLLYHEGVDGWKAIIESIKLKYPKA